MGKMFSCVSDTWSPQKGCLHACPYCWAKKLAEGRLKAQGGKYANGFAPTFFPGEMKRKFKPGGLVFVCPMGDLFGNWVKADVIQFVIDKVAGNPQTDFLFLTKNPYRYLEFEFPQNCYLGTTLETNAYSTADPLMLEGNAQPPVARLAYLSKKVHPRKFVSIEPIMNFDYWTFRMWLFHLMPSIVEIGADNYHNHLPEPPWYKVANLIKDLREWGITVYEKESLKRLEEGGGN